MKITESRLRQIIKEELGRSADKAGTGLPGARDLAKKLSAAGPDEALSFLARVLNNVSLGAPAEPAPVEDPAPPVPPSDSE